MNVDNLRKLASSLGIKNVKKYKKEELLKLVEEKQKAAQPIDLNDKKKEYVGRKVILTSNDEKKEGKVDRIYTKSKDKTPMVTIKIGDENINITLDELENRKTDVYSLDVKERDEDEQYLPKGEQSLKILQMIKDHPHWSHYKISQLLKCSYTNVHRVWKIYGTNIIKDKRNFGKYKKEEEK